MKVADVISELVEERGLEKETLHHVVCEGMIAAYERKYPGFAFKAEEDPATGDLIIFVQKKVVSTVEDQDTEVSLKKARNIDKDIQIDQQIWVPFEGKVGRIEILRARQVIASKIRHIEALAVYNEYKDKQGQIFVGVINKIERNGVSVKLGDVFAFLPKSLSIPGERFNVGYSIRALLKEVLLEPVGDNQLILDRISSEFLKGLFELEIPEIYEKLVVVKKIVRSPGYKSKIAVASNDKNIDPVGTCVGIGGSRIKPILKELSGEKIDIFPWSDSVSLLVKNALKPAVINKVEIAANNKTAQVWLNEDQRSFAIGKGGQNIALAAQLTGVSIQLVTEDQKNIHVNVDQDEVDQDEED